MGFLAMKERERTKMTEKIVESPLGPIKVLETKTSTEANSYYMELLGPGGRNDVVENAIVVVASNGYSTTKTSNDRHLQNSVIDWFVSTYVRRGVLGHFYVKKI